MRSREQPSLSWIISLLRVDWFTQETRFLGFLLFNSLFTKLVKPGFGNLPETRYGLKMGCRNNRIKTTPVMPLKTTKPIINPTATIA
jgi:hypothetical protein